MTIKAKPILGITMGDPTGIGPEIVAKALATDNIYKICMPVVVGDANIMQQAVEIADVDLDIRSISKVTEAKFEFGHMDVIDLKNVDVTKLEHGKVSAMAGAAAFAAVEKVIELALNREIDGTVTVPINKEALNKAGYDFSGHTEIYAHFTGAKDYAMLLVYRNVRIIHVSTHVSLREAIKLVKKDRIVKVIELLNDACKKLGVQSPKIGVAGLNPHASDGGLFGDEEKKEIIPAIEKTRNKGILVDGPVPPDTLFSKLKGGWYDGAVAMYHDQGHIPLKVIGFIWDKKTKKWKSVSGVNITLGLPIVRTSVDHGTAFEIAGKGIALPDSLIYAIEFAAKLVSN